MHQATTRCVGRRKPLFMGRRGATRASLLLPSSGFMKRIVRRGQGDMASPRRGLQGRSQPSDDARTPSKRDRGRSRSPENVDTTSPRMMRTRSDHGTASALHTKAHNAPSLSQPTKIPAFLNQTRAGVFIPRERLLLKDTVDVSQRSMRNSPN